MLKRDLSKIARYPAPVRIMLFAVPLLLLWGLLTGISVWLIADANTANILTLLLLYSQFIVLVRVWGQYVYGQPNLLWRYGLDLTQRSCWELLLGLVIGTGCLFALMETQASLGWVVWKPPSDNFLQVAVEGLLVALGFGFAEELLFRGWLLDELQRDYHPTIALWVNALIYAALHGFRLQFPALVVLGLTFVWAKRACGTAESGWRRDRLALPMGLHAGLVWGYYLVKVGQLIESPNRVPTWITGIDANPLAGAMGILFVSSLALSVRHFSKPQRLDQV